MGTDGDFLTVRQVAAKADCGEQFIRELADRGLIPCIRIARGIRLFGATAPAEVVRIKAQRAAARVAARIVGAV